MRKCTIRNISIGLISLGSFLIGASVGIKVSQWGEESSYFEDAEKEPCEEFDHYIEDNTMTPEEVDEMLKQSYLRRRATDIVFENDYISSADPDGDDLDDMFDPIVNSLTIGGDEVPITKETKDLDEVKEPQVISEDFYFNEIEYSNYVKETLTYFEDDDTLIDEKDQVIYDVDSVIGAEALNSFGHMSNDKDTVFVINHRLGIKYEVIRDPGKYTEIVLGIPDEEPDYVKAKKFFKDLEEREE